MAITLPGAGTYSYDSSGLANDYTNYLGTCSTSGKKAAGADMVFSVSVAPGQILDIDLTPDANSDPVLLLTSACPNPVSSCLEYADDGDSGDPETISYVNTTAAAQTIFIIADNYSSGQGGPFQMVVGLHTPVCGDGMVEGAEGCDDMNTVAGDGCTACVVDSGYHCSGAPSVCVATHPGDTCGNAIPVAASGTFAGTYTGFFNDTDPGDSGCTGISEPGADVIYAVTMGAGQFLQATLTPGDDQDVALYVLTDCGQPATACAAGADTGYEGDAEMVSYSAATAQTVYVVVDGPAFFDPLTGPYSLALSVITPMCGDGVLEGAEQCDDGNSTDGDGCSGCVIDDGYHCSGSPSTCVQAPPGDLCSSPIKIGGSGSKAGTFDGFTNDYDPGDSGCTGYEEPGVDVAYSIILTAGQTLTATVTPGDDQDVALYLVTDCGDLANTCADGEDEGGEGDPETLTYTAPTAQTVYLIVDSFLDDNTGPFTLDVTLQ